MDTDGNGLIQSTDTIINLTDATGLSTSAVSFYVTGGTGADTITGGALADSITGGSGADVITAGSGNDTVNGGAGADTINVGAGTDVIVIGTGDSAEVGTGSAFTSAISSGNVALMDIVTGMGNGDVIDVTAFGTGIAAVGTSLLTAAGLAGAAGAAVVRGIYDTSLNTFTTGATDSTYNDYVVQVSNGTSIDTVLLVDIVGTVSGTAAAGVITLSVS